MILSELSKEEFQKFSEAREDYNIWQSVDMAELRELAGFHTEYAGVREDGKIIAGAMLSYRVLMGYRQYYSPRGFLVNFQNTELLKEFLKAVQEFCRRRKGMSLRFDPYLPYQQRDLDGNAVPGGFNHEDIFRTVIDSGFKHHGFTRGIDLSRECRWMYVIPLEGKTEETLLNSFERNARRSVQRTIKYQIYTKELDESSIDEFIRVAVATGERRGFEVRSAEYYRDLLRIFGSRGHDGLKELFLVGRETVLPGKVLFIAHQCRNIRFAADPGGDMTRPTIIKIRSYWNGCREKRTVPAVMSALSLWPSRMPKRLCLRTPVKPSLPNSLTGKAASVLIRSSTMNR